MTGPSGVDKAHVETIIADLRRTYEQLKQGRTAPDVKTWSMRLTLEEVGALLEIHDEVIELRRQTIGDWEPDFPPVRVSAIDVVAARLDVDGVRPHVTIPEPGVYAVNADGAVPITGPHGIRTCPHAGTHHSCPLGGCPTLENREVTIPDLPRCEHREYGRDAGRCVKPLGHDGKHLIDRRDDGDPRGPLLVTGREERETPPTEADAPDLPHDDRRSMPAPPGSTHALCVVCEARIVRAPGHSAWRHLILGGYGAPHEARPHA